MKIWRKILAILVAFPLIISLVAACSGTRTENRVGQPEPGEIARPPDLAHGPITRLTIEGAVNTGFGEAVAVSGDTLVVGATDWNLGPGEQYGSVYVYQRVGEDWEQQARLTSSDGRDGFQYDQHFGRSVAIAGDTLVVGAPDADHPEAGDNTGAVYVFRRQGAAWEQSAKLEAAGPRAHDRFGNRLSLHGDILAIAGDQDDALFVFVRGGDAWVQQARLGFPLPPASRWREISLALYGDTLAAGATDSPFFTLAGSGTVLVFHRQGESWIRSTRLEGDRDFGISLAVGASPAAQPGQADTLVVGSGGDTRAGLYAGAVYVYGREGDRWIERALLTAADAMMDLPLTSNNAFFGSSVALQGDLLLVQGRFSSAVYVYQGQGEDWTDQLKVIIDQGFGEFEAWPLAIDGGTIVRGSPGEFGNSAHVFDIFTR